MFDFENRTGIIHTNSPSKVGLAFIILKYWVLDAFRF